MEKKRKYKAKLRIILIPVGGDGLLDLLPAGERLGVLGHHQVGGEVQHGVQGRHPLESVPVHGSSDGVPVSERGSDQGPGD